VNIIWDDEKNEWLKRERNMSFEEVAAMILEKKYVAVVEHPKRSNQQIFLIPIHGYIHAVPFVLDRENNVFLKTAYPSRKFNRKYGEKIDESKA
jgi:uncharacterized DUF497 family protein